MCGIAAILKHKDTRCSVAMLNRMRDDVAHRGPDDAGTAIFSHSEAGWIEKQQPASDSQNWEAGLAHRRLSILDLSAAGHQPMVYQGRYWIVYNGEIYNFIELRAELERVGYSFCSHSDTEVILAAYAEWGTDCFSRLRGMWGLVIFDLQRNIVILSRDRIGIKPIYFWAGNGLVAIASEIKEFLHVPGFVPRLDPVTCSEFLSTGYEESNRSFFAGVRPLPAGTWLPINLDSLSLGSPVSYWQPENIKVSIHDKQEAGQLFAEKLMESVRIHLRSDVPVGCALSGGLDSTAIAVLARQLQGETPGELHTFTSTFPGSNIDEKTHADHVAKHIQAIQHFVTPDPQTFLEDLDRFLWIHDEPVGSLSIYASYCLARLTCQQGIPVTLNGQGGDEILSGYWQTYFLFLRELFLQGKWLAIVQNYAGALFFNGNPELMRQTPLMFKRYRSRNNTENLLPVKIETGSSDPFILADILSLQGQERRVYEIRKMFLPRLLKWDDRNSMAFSVEGRYPLLDHELIELCLSFSPETLYQNGWVKWPLRTGLATALPANTLKRRTKFGFETPQNEWLRFLIRQTLNHWLEQDRPVYALIERSDIQRLTQLVWNSKDGRDEVGQALFRVFIFDQWLERFNVNCSLS